MMDLLLLGNGAMVPLPNRPLSSLLLRSRGSLVLFDCGEGTQVEMRRYHWGFRKLDAICLTHMHADHVAGLPGLLLTVANSGRTEPMHLLAPTGSADVLRGLLVIVPGLPFEVVLHEMAPGAKVELPNGLQVRAGEAAHRISCVAYRVDLHRAPAFDPDRAEAQGVPRAMWSLLQRGERVSADGRVVEPADVLGSQRRGVSLVFATDTRPIPALGALAADADLLVCEATYLDDADAAKANEWGHMTLRQATQIARDAQVGALWTTHFGAGVIDATAHQTDAEALFPATTMGFPGLQGKITFDAGYQAIDGRESKS